ncbi:MAG: 2-hydroxyacyl-CoA dehydratase, partial [Halanaerobiales bacterium]
GKVEFGKTFQYSNYARKYLNKINKLRQKSPAVISGEKMLNLIPMSFMSFGSKKGYKFYKMLFKEIKRRKKKNKGIITNEKYRLLWLHLKPYYKNNIFSTLNKMGAVTAFEEYNQVYWKPLDPKSPYESLAEKMINHFGWGKSKKQFEKLVAIINDYNIDGVIAFSQWGCRQNNGKMGLFKKLFKKYNIPFLNIEGDLVDSRNYREGQLKVRLQAFLELLENQGVKGRA